MSTTFSLASAVHVFPCPNCRETINTTITQCPFCGAGIDHASAEASAATTARVSKAVNDASMLRVLVGLYVPAFLLMFVPFLSLLGLVGFWLLRFAVPVMAVIWFVRYGKLESDDPDLPRARHRAFIMGAIGLAVLLFSGVHVFYNRTAAPHPQADSAPTTTFHS